MCVFSPHLFWTPSSLDVPAGVTQEEGHTGFVIHLPSAVHAFISLVTVKSNFCVLTIQSFSTCWAFFFFFNYIIEKKIKINRYWDLNSRTNVAGDYEGDNWATGGSVAKHSFKKIIFFSSSPAVTSITS